MVIDHHHRAERGVVNDQPHHNHGTPGSRQNRSTKPKTPGGTGTRTRRETRRRPRQLPRHDSRHDSGRLQRRRPRHGAYLWWLCSEPEDVQPIHVRGRLAREDEPVCLVDEPDDL